MIVVAKNDQAHDALAAQFKSRRVEKEYLAIVVGVPDRDQDIVDEPIGDHPTKREKKAIRRDHPCAREAATILRSGRAVRRLRPGPSPTQNRPHAPNPPPPGPRRLPGPLRPPLRRPLPNHRTGIDPTRANCRKIRSPASEWPNHIVLARHALHAHRLAFDHPVTGERVAFEAPLPNDLEACSLSLRRHERERQVHFLSADFADFADP